MVRVSHNLVARPLERRKRETAIRVPDFKMVRSADVYIWVVVKKNVHSDQAMYDKIF